MSSNFIVANWLSYKHNRPKQYAISLLLIIAVAGASYFLSDYIGYRTVALLLLVSVSLLAIFFDILPVLIAALLSALIWDFFFIPPHFTFTVSSPEDLLMLLMYFLIALVNAVLTFKIRQAEKKAIKKEQKENTVRLYNTLLNSLSHELRTPIATIIGASDNLMTEEEKLSSESKKELLEEISVASLRLNRQVENLLNMSRLESGFIQPNKDWCDINELVYGVVNQLKDTLKSHSVSVIINESLPLFKLDFGLMEQVLYNLVYNAATYTPRYCLITIRAICVNDRLVIYVEDNGEGFPAEEIEKAFDKFYRLKNSRPGGTGLGLSIVKGFVEAHDGVISLENMPEGGARFIIEIPAESSYINNLKNE